MHSTQCRPPVVPHAVTEGNRKLANSSPWSRPGAVQVLGIPLKFFTCLGPLLGWLYFTVQGEGRRGGFSET